MKQDSRAIGQARYLRREMTPAEVILWKHLRGRRFDEFKFRRQRPVGNYIVDFVCLNLKLILELDGESHLSKKDRDQERDAFLEAEGYRILRYWNNQVYDEIDSVLEDIYLVCHGKK
jgi:very-short-patch-repair endonuclease